MSALFRIVFAAVFCLFAVALAAPEPRKHPEHKPQNPITQGITYPAMNAQREAYKDQQTFTAPRRTTHRRAPLPGYTQSSAHIGQQAYGPPTRKQQAYQGQKHGNYATHKYQQMYAPQAYSMGGYTNGGNPGNAYGGMDIAALLGMPGMGINGLKLPGRDGSPFMSGL